MPRLLHLADVHLGARHPDLGPAASRMRERQAAAFRRAIDAGIEARVDVALICGDLFDSNVQGRRVVEAAALELRRLAEQSIRVVLIPGIHDTWEGGSIYRVFDLRLMAGLSEGSDLLTVLTPTRAEVVFRDLDLIVHGRVPATRRVNRSPLADFTVLADDRARWRVGIIHGALVTGADDGQEDVQFTPEEINASGLDYLAIGHGHGWQTGRAGGTTWTTPGAVEALRAGDEEAGRVAIVELTERSGRKSVAVREAVVGRTRFSTVTLDAADVATPGALVARLQTVADPEVVLDVVLRGITDRWLDADQTTLAAELADAFLAVRLRDESRLASPAATEAAPGTFERTFHDTLLEHAAAAEKAGDMGTAHDARAAYQLGRRLLDDPRQVGQIFEMRITRLHVQAIRQLADLDLKPAAGLTVVRGANESGKSTIQTALEMVLFHDPTSIAPALLDLRTWGSKVDPQVRLEFEHEGRKGHLEKVFAGSRGTVELSYDGRVLRDPDEVRAVVADITGLASEEFLRSTASVRHGELEDLDQDALHDRLQRSVSGAAQSTRAAHRQLAEAVLRYRGDGGEASGRIDRTRDELERARADLVAGETGLAQLERDRSALALAHDRRADLDMRLVRDQEQVEMGERAVRLISSANESEARYMRLRQAADLQVRINTAERSHPLPMPLHELRERTHRIKELQFQIQELEVLSELRTDGPTATPRAVRPPRWQPVALLAMIAAAAALVAAGAGILVSAPIVGLVVAAMMFGIGVALMIVAIRMARRVRLVKAQAQMQAAEIDRRLTGKGQEDTQLRETRRERDALLTVLGVPDVYAADTMLERAAAHNAGVDELRAEMRGLLAGVEVAGDVIAERDRAASEMEQSRHVLSALGGAGIDPSALRETALKALHDTQVERETAIQDEGQAQGRVDQNDVDAEQVAVLAERIAGLERDLADMEQRVRVYDLTLATLDVAEGDTVKQAARYLEERMGEDVSRITDGRYRQVRVNEQDLSFEVWSPELPGWVAVQQLSEATLDQVYLAARLGLVRQVTQDRRPPLIFDDPFVIFDTDRARRSADLLKDLAPDHQVLFLTTSDRYDSVADSVIELPAPAARDTDGPSVDRLPRVLSPDPVYASTNGAAQARARDGWPAMDLTDRAPWAVAD